MSTSGGGTYEVRYAPYIEEAHKEALNNLDALILWVLGSSPYGDYEKLDYHGGLIGEDYLLKDFPSLWDMYGKFMGGLDVETLWSQLYNRVTRGSEISDAVSAQSELLRDDINKNVLPDFLAGMRDINAVQSSAFILGKAIIQDSKTKALSKFAGDIRIESFKVSAQLWQKHLEWNSTVIDSYREMFKTYFLTHFDETERQMKWDAKHQMWGLNVMDHKRAMIGAAGSGHPVKDQNEPSTTSSALAGAASGAAMGTAVMPGWGTVIGGAVGLVAGLF